MNMRNFVALMLVGASAQVQGMQKMQSYQPIREAFTKRALVAGVSTIMILGIGYCLKELYLNYYNPYTIVYLQNVPRVFKNGELLSPQATEKIDWTSGYGKRAISSFFTQGSLETNKGQPLPNHLARQLITKALQGKKKTSIEDSLL
jgi:hypothetical protein